MYLDIVTDEGMETFEGTAIQVGDSITVDGVLVAFKFGYDEGWTLTATGGYFDQFKLRS